MEPPLPGNHRNHIDTYILDIHKSSLCNRMDHLADLGLSTLDFHAHRSVIFISYPSGAACHLGCLPRAVPEADSLYPAVKPEFLSDLLTHCVTVLSLI